MNKKNNNPQKKKELAERISARGKRIKVIYKNIYRFVFRIFQTASNWFDKILASARYTKYVALFLAIVFYVGIFLVNTNENLVDLAKNAKSFPNIQVEAIYSDQIYEVEGIPNSVSVTAIGDTSDLLLLSQQNDLRVRLDLSTYGEGEHTVELTPVNFSNRLDVKIEPATVNVKIIKKENRQFSFTHEFINQLSMDETLALGTPTFSENQVYVKASKEKLDKVAYVKALIDVSNQSEDFVTMAKLVAYDKDGNTLEVQILPSEIEVSVPVSRPQKEVGIEVNFTGNLPKGKLLESYDLDVKTATIFGSQSVLDEIDSLVINVPLDNVTGDKVIAMPVQRPNGVNSISVSTVEITIHIKDSDVVE